MSKIMKPQIHLQQMFYNRLIGSRWEKSSEDFNINSVAAFHAILVKERARVDRNSHVFSIVAFEVGRLDSGIVTPKYFIDSLKKKIRITDEIGWVDKHSIGVLLFNAGRAEAIRFIEKIQENYYEETLCKYSISTYPEDSENHHNNCARHNGLANTCHHSMPGVTSSHVQRKNPDRPIALQLQPIFYDDISIWKRLSDIVLSTSALIVLGPLLIVTAIAVKFSSKGPIFFKQKRAGLGGKPFTILKFRTMHVDAEEKKRELLQFNERTGPVFKMENDPRITRLGVHLRRWSLDEFPQLFNVLVGDMSLVGPRPPSLDEVAKYANWHKYRLEMKPGITCIWQVYARHEKSFENWVRLDIKYRREQSFLLDMKLLFMTIPAVLSRRGAC